MGRASRRKKGKITIDKNLSEKLDFNFNINELELISNTLKYIRDSVRQDFLNGQETAFFILDNEGKGYSKKVKECIQSELNLMDFPLTTHIYLEEAK